MTLRRTSLESVVATLNAACGEGERVITVDVHTVRRLRNTRNGNPQWQLDCADGSSFDIGRDSSASLCVNPSWEGETVVLRVRRGWEVVDAAVTR